MRSTPLLLGSLLSAIASAQQSAWGQCGGNGWTGATTCVSGYTCSAQNEWYSQCIPGTQTTLSTSKMTTSSSMKPPSSVPTSKMSSTASAPATGPTGGSGKFKWLGVDESGAEFGQTTIPGADGKDFTFASTTSIDTLMSQGFNIFRLPFLMERMAVGSITAPLDAAYLANYTAVVNHITGKGGYAVVDPHNFGRYNGAIITSTADFGTFWANLASTFKSNSHVIFDTNNEYHDMDQTLVLNLNQAAINAIRGPAGATSQYIFAEGNSYSGAWTWTTVNDNLKALTDPSNMLVYEMHQYLDSDGSGTSDVCVSTTIGVDRVTAATQWLKQNGKLGIIGEFAAGANPTCQTAVTGFLNYLQSNSDVWLGAIWWGGGPWWGDYIYGFEPPSSTGYNYYDTLLKSHAP